VEWNTASRKTMMSVFDEPLYNDLCYEIYNGDDNAAAIQEMLKRSSFETFSEDRKLAYLVGARIGSQTQPISDMSLLSDVIEEDALDTFLLLLPKIPTFKLTRRRIPKEYQWIGSLPAVQRFLHTTESRWRPGKCSCTSHVEPSTTAERHCAITKLASDTLAAGLFCLSAKVFAAGSPFNSNKPVTLRCMMYLLAVCPELLSIPVCTESLAKTLLHIPELGEVFLDTHVLKYLHHSIENLVGDLLAHVAARTRKSSLKYVKVFVGVAGRLFTDKLMHYRSRNGSSFLHIVCQMQVPFYDDEVYFVKLLLRLGFDPAETNDEGLTALDVLFQEYYDRNLEVDVIRNWIVRKEVLELLLATVSAMLPYFKDKAIASLTLPKLSPGVYDSRIYMLDMIKVWEVFLDVNLFPQFAFDHLFTVVNSGLIVSSSPCVTCEPLSMLVHREMCKGMPVESPHIVYRYPQCLLDEIILRIHRLYGCRLSAATLNYRTAFGPPECCLWKTAELIIHSTASLGSRVTAKLLLDPPTMRDRAGALKVSLDVVRSVMRMLWMYVPSSTPRVVAFLQSLATAPDAEARDTAAELLGMVEGRPRPLAMLARNSFVRAVEYKDISKLRLPPSILRYVLLGDISPEHPVGQN
jgi:hypothetical protein